MTKLKSQKSVYSFKDYREFLRHYYAYQKSLGRGFTYESFAQAAGLNSPNYMKLVMEGTRNLTTTGIQEFAGALGLKGQELSYFEAMVLHNQAKSKAEEKYYGARMREILAKKPRTTGRARLTAHLSQWYFPAVYLCLKDEPAEGAVSRTAAKLKLNEKEVQAVVDELVSKQLLTIEGGVYRIEYEHLISRDKNKASQVQRQFLQSQLELSAAAFQKRQATGDRDARFFSHTLSTTKEQYEKYFTMVHELFSDMTTQAQDEGKEKMLQVNVQLFPLDYV